MNVASGALITLLLLLPALFFRFGITMLTYGTISRKKADSFASELAEKNFIDGISKLNFSDTLFFFAIVPVLLHAVSLCLLQQFGYKINFALLLNVLSNQKGVVRDNVDFTFQLISFLWYIIILASIGLFLGLGVAHTLVRTPNWYQYLIGNNLFFTLFTGLLLDQDKRSLVDMIWIDVTVENKEGTLIYSGFLEKFDIMPDVNQLAYITLSCANRRDLRKGSWIEDLGNKKYTSFDIDNGEISKIPGEFFTITGNKILNINVVYLNFHTITNPLGQEERIMVPII